MKSAPDRFDATFASRWTVVLFLLVIAAPIVRMLVPIAETRDAAALRFEARTQPPAAPRSVSAIAHYPRELVQYFDGRFGFRGPLMHVFARLKLSGVAVADSQRVLVGNDGWLYLSGDHIADDLAGRMPFSESDLAAWKTLLERRRDWLRARGIPFVFFVAPNTQTIYPEHLPSWIVHGGAPTRREQLLAYMKEHSDVAVLDVTPPLRAAKKQQQVYYRTDTHWNLLGGYVVYKALSEWLVHEVPEWRTRDLSDFERTDTPAWRGALSYMLGAPELAEEVRPELTARDLARVETDGEPLPSDETRDAWYVRPVVVRTSTDGEVGNAVIFRDSQMAAPAQFLSRHFRRSVLVWSNTFDPALIEREHPRVVIEEMVERSLNGPVPQDPALGP